MLAQRSFHSKFNAFPRPGARRLGKMTLYEQHASKPFLAHRQENLGRQCDFSAAPLSSQRPMAQHSVLRTASNNKPFPFPEVQLGPRLVSFTQDYLSKLRSTNKSINFHRQAVADAPSAWRLQGRGGHPQGRAGAGATGIPATGADPPRSEANVTRRCRSIHTATAVAVAHAVDALAGVAGRRRRHRRGSWPRFGAGDDFKYQSYNRDCLIGLINILPGEL